MSISLAEFNALSPIQAQQLLKNCAHIPSWVVTMTAQRSFDSLTHLYTVAEHQSQTWAWEEVKQALDQHPKIGQKQAKQALSSQEQNFSAKEQGSLQLNNTTAEALVAGNQRYEQQFGYIFLIRAVGRSVEEILAELQRRLANTPQVEQQEVKQQLAQIALLRLQQEIHA